MLIRTDNHKELKKARITLESELTPSCYHKVKGETVLNLPVVADRLKAIESSYVNPSGGIIMTLSTKTPVGYHNTCEWLVIDLQESEPCYRATSNWADFLAEIAAKFIQVLSPKDEGRIARIEYGHNKGFVVMDDPDSDT